MRLVIFTLLLSCTGLFSATYYVDYVGGSDSNNGTSKATPFKRAPGMKGCTGTCASTTVQAGDSIILKGGVTWPAAALCWLIESSGSSGNRIYMGVDQTWFTGASWTRPILNGGGASLGPCVANGGSTTLTNVFVVLAGAYLTLDNIEFTNAKWGYGEDMFINGSFGPDHFIVSNCYFHGWSNRLSSGAGSDTGYGFYRSPGYPITSGILDHNVYDGSDTSDVIADPNCSGSCLATGGFYYGFLTEAKYNVVRYASNGFIGDIRIFHDNLIEYIRQSPDPSMHMNGFENNSNCNARIYNNVIHGSVTTSVVMFWFATMDGCTDYVFNNVIYDTGQGNVLNVAPIQGCGTADCGPQGTAYVINNTVEAGPDSGPNARISGCDSHYAACILGNNHQISSTLNIESCPGINCTVASNVFQSKATANAQGYTIAQQYVFSPTSADDATVTAGYNYTALCSIDAHMANLCMDTTFGVTYDAVNHMAVAPARPTLARPTTGAWDVGAYRHFPHSHRHTGGRVTGGRQ
jgi:hypothetical protein